MVRQPIYSEFLGKSRSYETKILYNRYRTYVVRNITILDRHGSIETPVTVLHLSPLIHLPG